MKKEIYQLVENAVDEKIKAYNKYVEFSKTSVFEEGKRLYDFGLRSETALNYKKASDFISNYNWLVEAKRYYKEKYPNLTFLDKSINDSYFFEKYKSGSLSEARMLSLDFKGQVKPSEMDIIEKNLLLIDNNDRVCYHHVGFREMVSGLFKDLGEDEKQKAIDGKDGYGFHRVKVIAHSYYFFDGYRKPSEYFAVFVCPVKDGYLILKKIND